MKEIKAVPDKSLVRWQNSPCTELLTGLSARPAGGEGWALEYAQPSEGLRGRHREGAFAECGEVSVNENNGNPRSLRAPPGLQSSIFTARLRGRSHSYPGVRQRFEPVHLTALLHGLKSNEEAIQKARGEKVASSYLSKSVMGRGNKIRSQDMTLRSHQSPQAPWGPLGWTARQEDVGRREVSGKLGRKAAVRGRDKSLPTVSTEREVSAYN